IEDFIGFQRLQPKPFARFSLVRHQARIAALIPIRPVGRTLLKRILPEFSALREQKRQ
ncbi:hypothetical protein GY977_23640, partial [Escherichia coli]|nr:hypothetical protein [Escherichia coli]